MAEEDENTAIPLTKDTKEVRQSLGGAVSAPKWYVAAVRRNREEICRKQLHESGIEAYVACQKETHVYRNRHQREITRIVIPGIVFIHVNENQRLQVLKDNPHIQFFLTNKAAQSNSYGRHPFAVIPDAQMDTLRFMLYHAEAPVSFTAEPLHLGDHIRIIRGQLAGLEGAVTRDANSTHIVVTIDLLGSAMVTISPDDIEKIA